jgi:RNA polymerase sigma factor (sigma-70 family)
MMNSRIGALLEHLRQLSAEQDAENLSDQELVERYAVNRDEAAFGVLVRRHGPMVWRVCLAVTKHEQDAEDAFQAAFLVLARRPTGIRKRASFVSWLHGVAYRVALRTRAQALPPALPMYGAEIMSQEDPLTKASQREGLAILHDELNQLADKYRAPLVLCYLEDKTQDEAARQLAWSISTFRRRLGKARELLQLRVHRRGLALSALLASGTLAHAAQGRALPAGLLLATMRATQTWGTSLVAASGASSKAAALAEGVLQATASAHLKTVVVLALVWAIAVAGTGLLVYRAWVGLNPDAAPLSRPTTGSAAQTPASVPKERNHPDPFGDPLPDDALARLGTTRLRVATPSLSTVAFASDGKTVAAGGDGAVRMWELATGKTVCSLPMPGIWIRSVAFAPDGKTLAAGGMSHTIRVWDVRTGAVVREFREPAGKVFGLVFSPDGRILVSGSERGAVRAWGVATGEECGRLDLPALPNEEAYPWPIAIFPDNRTLATTDRNNRLRLWNVTTGVELRQRDWLSPKLHALALAPNSPEGALLAAVGGHMSTIRLWQVASGHELRQWRGPAGHVDALGFSADGKLLASGDSERMIRLWQVATGAELGQIQTDEPGFRGLAFSPDGQVLASWGDATIRLWQVATGEELCPFAGHRDGIRAIAFLPDDQHLVSAGTRGTLYRWDAATGRQPSSLRAAQRELAHAAALSPDGRGLAFGEATGLLRFVDPVTGQELRQWQAHRPGYQGAIYSLAFSPDGQTLATGGKDKTVAIWDPWTGREVHRFVDNAAEVTAVACSPDRRLVAWGGPDSNVTLGEVATGQIQHRFQVRPHQVRCLAFSPDGKTLASATEVAFPAGQRPARVDLWEVATGQPRWHLEVPDWGSLAVAFSPDGRLLALGGFDHQIRRWDLAAGQELPPLTGHLGGVTCLAFSRDGTRLASGSMDHTALVWKSAPLPLLTTLWPVVAPPQELEVLWNDLAGADAGRAYRAMWALATADGQAVALLQTRLRPASETGGRSEDQRRRLRALEVLERIGTPEAHRLLRTLVTTSPETRVAAEARAALDRLDKRRAVNP